MKDKPAVSQIKYPLHLALAAQGPIGILDASGRAVAWFSDSFSPTNGFVWEPENKHVPDPDSGTTCYSERNKAIRAILELLNVQPESRKEKGGM